MTPPPGELAEALHRIDRGELPVPGRLAVAATYAALNGCINLDADNVTLTDQGRRVLAILGGST